MDTQQTLIAQQNEDIKALVTRVLILEQESQFLAAKLGITRAKIIDPRVQLAINRAQEHGGLVSGFGAFPGVGLLPPGGAPQAFSPLGPTVTSTNPLLSSLKPFPSGPFPFDVQPGGPMAPFMVKQEDQGKGMPAQVNGILYAVPCNSSLGIPSPAEEAKKRVEFSLGAPKKFGDEATKAGQPSAAQAVPVRTEENRTEPDEIANKFLDDLVKKMSGILSITTCSYSFSGRG